MRVKRKRIGDGTWWIVLKKRSIAGHANGRDDAALCLYGSEQYYCSLMLL